MLTLRSRRSWLAPMLQCTALRGTDGEHRMRVWVLALIPYLILPPLIAGAADRPAAQSQSESHADPAIVLQKLRALGYEGTSASDTAATPHKLIESFGARHYEGSSYISTLALDKLTAHIEVVEEPQTLLVDGVRQPDVSGLCRYRAGLLHFGALL